MSWQKIVLVTLYSVNVILIWNQIDEYRKPYTPGFALWATLWTAGIAAMVIYA